MPHYLKIAYCYRAMQNLQSQSHKTKWKKRRGNFLKVPGYGIMLKSNPNFAIGLNVTITTLLNVSLLFRSIEPETNNIAQKFFKRQHSELVTLLKENTVHSCGLVFFFGAVGCLSLILSKP
jgi:hypothetical protein